MQSMHFWPNAANALPQIKQLAPSVWCMHESCPDHVQLLPQYPISIPTSHAHPLVANQEIA